MKLEIEISEDEIKSAIERKVRVAIADQTNQWSVDIYIKEMVKQHWKAAAEQMVIDGVADAPRLQEKVRETIEAKLKGRINALMKVAK